MLPHLLPQPALADHRPVLLIDQTHDPQILDKPIEAGAPNSHPLGDGIEPRWRREVAGLVRERQQHQQFQRFEILWLGLIPCPRRRLNRQ
jgi:hypothetical protein